MRIIWQIYLLKQKRIVEKNLNYLLIIESCWNKIQNSKYCPGIYIMNVYMDMDNKNKHAVHILIFCTFSTFCTHCLCFLYVVHTGHDCWVKKVNWLNTLLLHKKLENGGIMKNFNLCFCFIRKLFILQERFKSRRKF